MCVRPVLFWHVTCIAIGKWAWAWARQIENNKCIAYLQAPDICNVPTAEYRVQRVLRRFPKSGVYAILFKNYKLQFSVADVRHRVGRGSLPSHKSATLAIRSTLGPFAAEVSAVK